MIIDNGAEIARVVADGYREDLATAGFGDGRHGFRCTVPGGLAAPVRYRLQFYLDADGTPLDGASIVLEATGTLVTA